MSVTVHTCSVAYGKNTSEDKIYSICICAVINKHYMNSYEWNVKKYHGNS